MIKKIVLGICTASALCLNAVALETDNAFLKMISLFKLLSIYLL